jgi:hypothetical protein
MSQPVSGCRRIAKSSSTNRVYRTLPRLPLGVGQHGLCQPNLGYNSRSNVLNWLQRKRIWQLCVRISDVPRHLGWGSEETHYVPTATVVHNHSPTSLDP